jgi:hypothetical protein
MLNSLTSETARAIVGSQFSAKPNFEYEYYEHIKTRDEYFGMYVRWVLSQSPLPPLPEDAELYAMREDILGIRGGKTAMSIDYPLLYFFFDMISPFLDRLIDTALSYYALADDGSRNGKKLSIAVTNAMVGTFILCDAEEAAHEGYVSFLTVFLDTFKVLFAKEIGSGPTAFSFVDKEFVAAFEREWRRLWPYSDALYGFEVMPVFSPEDMFRYLRLPFSAYDLRNLSMKPEYRQVMNYVAAMATFKPVPDCRVRMYFRQELCRLFAPLVSHHIEDAKKKMEKSKAPLTSYGEECLRECLNGKVLEAVASFDYFYATTKNLQKKKISPFGKFFLPLRGRLAVLGHIFEQNEYPFTAYIGKMLKKETDQYFFNDKLPFDANSLDVLVDPDKNTRRVDLILEASASGDGHVPNYDAVDRNNRPVGWKTDTFAGIMGMGSSTLRRWEDLKLIKPKRYAIFSKKHRRIVEYRAYAREDMNRAREISEQMKRAMRHEK